MSGTTAEFERLTRRRRLECKFDFWSDSPARHIARLRVLGEFDIYSERAFPTADEAADNCKAQWLIRDAMTPKERRDHLLAHDDDFVVRELERLCRVRGATLQWRTRAYYRDESGQQHWRADLDIEPPAYYRGRSEKYYENNECAAKAECARAALRRLLWRFE